MKIKAKKIQNKICITECCNGIGGAAPKGFGASFCHVLLGNIAIVSITPNPLNIGDKPTASADGLSPRVSSKSAQRSLKTGCRAPRSAYQASSSRNLSIMVHFVAQNRQILLTRGVSLIQSMF
jgi:hypothetical protein